MTSENDKINETAQQEDPAQQDPQLTIKETAAQLTEMYLMLNREVGEKVKVLTSSKLKKLHQRVAAYPLEFSNDDMTLDEKAAYELLIKIKNLYVDLFLLSEHARSRGIQLLPELKKEESNGKQD